MSNTSQKKFLTTILNGLGEKNVEAYRRQTADKQHHNFTLTRRAVRKGMKDYLTTSDPDITRAEISSILKAIDPNVKAFIKKVGNNLVTLANKDSTVEVLKNTAATKQAAFEVKNGKSRYDKVYSRYSIELKLLIQQFGIVVKKEVAGREVLNLSHADFEGIIESVVSDSIDKAVAEDALITRASAEAFFKNRGIDLKVLRDTTTMIMNVSLSSTTQNLKDKDASKARLNEMRRILRELLEDLEKGGTLTGLEGSDSFLTIKKKQTINNVLNPFRSNKNTSVSKEQKIKHSKNTVKKSKKGSTRVLAKTASGRKRKAVVKRKSSAASYMLQMIAMINKELPQTVRKNMQLPRLENRTGRLANSVKVTEIVKTPKGFPSVGYTYQKNPYEVFETSSVGPWSTPERDPRKLIDKSIREIAARMAIGRFYTRRV